MRFKMIPSVFVCVAIAFSGEVDVKIPMSTLNNSLQAMANAQVFTVVSPEGVPYREQTQRLRLTTVSVSAGPGSNQLKWDLKGLFRYPNVGIGNVELRGYSYVSVSGDQQGIKLTSCLDPSNLSVSVYDPILNGVVHLLVPIIKNAVLGQLRICAQFASPIENYLPSWQVNSVQSLTSSVNANDNTIGLKLVTVDSPPLKNTQGINPAIIQLLLD